MEIKEKIYNRNPLMLLSYLSKNRSTEFLYGKKIAENIGINQGSTSIILKEFKNMGLLKSENAGKTVLYNIDKYSPLVKSFRVFENLLGINELTEKVKPYTRLIILFGSCAKGDDNLNSDIDLFIVADDDNKDFVQDEVSSYKIDREINLVIVNTLELMDMEETDKVFVEEIYKGIKLWEGVCE